MTKDQINVTEALKRYADEARTFGLTDAQIQDAVKPIEKFQSGLDALSGSTPSSDPLIDPFRKSRRTI